jgi:hypothetical protein
MLPMVVVLEQFEHTISEFSWGATSTVPQEHSAYGLPPAHSWVKQELNMDF